MEELKNLISILVPVYKVEPYLDCCVQSIVDQTYKNLEIILVDDGSPDNCPTMCDAWAERDKRIHVIHKTNGGLSDARNAGMEAANGEFIGFVDSDDWVASDMFEKLLSRMVSTNSDIVSCGAFRVWDDETPSRKMIKSPGEYVFDRTEAMKALIQSDGLIQTVWNKLYKASIIKNIPFPKGEIHEDEFWSWRVFAAASKVATIPEDYYYYRQRTAGIMGNGYTGFPLLVVEAKEARHQYILENIPELADIDGYNLIDTCYYQGIQVLRNEKDAQKKAQYFKELKGVVERYEVGSKYLMSLTKKQQISFEMIKKRFSFACKLAVIRGVK